MICIDHLVEEMFREELSKLLIDAEPPASPRQTDRAPSPEEWHAYAVTSKKDPLRNEKLDKDMLIVSCGILEFEDSHLSLMERPKNLKNDSTGVYS